MVAITTLAPSRLVAVALMFATWSIPLIHAACECGYRDPLTDALWTDRTITYFNETGFNDVVTQPAQSPRIYGGQTVGATGEGSQAWSLVGDLVNKWEESFDATYRSAVSYNNTFINDNALALQVSPAERVHRIVNGSQIVTRRRDILYGSFRAQIEPAVSRGAGAAFKFSAAYNDSQTVDIGIFTSDDPKNSTLQWSWSAYGKGSDPVKTNISSLGTYDYLEHRFDWQSDLLQWRNAATNESANFYSVQKGVNATRLPIAPVPISFWAWSNGEHSQSQGPPLRQPLLTHVRYARFFFNSSLEERHSQFESQCSAVSGNGDAVCSTDDMTLRNSTAFDLAALSKMSLPNSTYQAPLYAVIVISIAAGIFVMTIAHGLVVRSIKAKSKKQAVAIAAHQGSAQQKETDKDSISATTSDTRVEQWSLPPVLSALAAESASIGKSPPPTPMDAESIDDKALLFGRETPTSGATSPTSGAARTATTPVQLWISPDLVYGSDTDSDDDSDLEDDSDASSFNRSHTELGSKASGVLPRYNAPSTKSGPPSVSLHGRESPAGAKAELPRWVEDMRQSQALPYVAPGFAGEPAASVYAHSVSSRRGSWIEAASDKGDLEEIELVEDGKDHLSASASGSVSGASRPPSRQGHHATYDQQFNRPQHGESYSAIDATVTPAASTYDFQHEGTSRPSSVYDSYGSEAHEDFTRPQIIQWQQRDLNAADGEVGALAQPELGDAHGRKARDGGGSKIKLPESLIQSMLRRTNELLFIKGTTQLTSTGARRIDYLDGMRGFACFLVSFHHFMLIYYFGITTPDAAHHYPKFEFWFRSLIGPIVVNQGLKLGIFFMLPSRTMTNRYLLKGGLQSMADNTVRRVPRLALPVAGAVLANYFFMDVGAFKWVPRLASRTWSTWSYWQNFDNVMVFLDAFISLWWSAPPVQPALVTGYATGVLWTIPVILQGTWTCLVCALVAHEIKTAYKRFSFYALCITLSWYAGTWDLYFMSGLVVADLDSKLNYQAWAAKGIPLVPGFVRRGLHLPAAIDKLRVHGQVLAWILFLAAWTQQYLSQIPGAPGNGFDNWGDHRLHPNWSEELPHFWVDDGTGVGYTDPRVSSYILSFSFFLLTDLSNLLRAFFRLRIWSYIGRNAFGVFLMHGVVFWTWSAWLCLTLLTAGVPYWATILVVFVTSYGLLFIVAECFTATFDSWGGYFSKAVWRATSGGLGR